jgi:NADH dehydrogenase [ubiquinone] 1 alpha subcomplex assembly factor 3
METTQTDFSSLDVLGGTPVPSTAVDACLWDGFHLNNGVKITRGAGVLLVGGEAFGWRPWDAGTQKGEGKGMRLLNAKGQWEVEGGAWGLLEVVWPKPGWWFSIFGFIWPVRGCSEERLV